MYQNIFIMCVDGVLQKFFHISYKKYETKKKNVTIIYSKAIPNKPSTLY